MEENGFKMRSVVRGGFAALFLVELANYGGLLDFTVDFTWLGLLVTVIAVWGSLEACARWLARRGTRLHWSAWPLSLAIVAFDAFGDMLHLYGRWHWYDQFGHALGGFLGVLVAFAVVRAVERTDHWRHPPWVNGLLALGTTMTFGCLYEIEEYLEDIFNATNRLGDGQDTANDLLMNLLGALVAIAFVFAAQKSRPRRRG
jgi:hypothetical protein